MSLNDIGKQCDTSFSFEELDIGSLLNKNRAPHQLHDSSKKSCFSKIVSKLQTIVRSWASSHNSNMERECIGGNIKVILTFALLSTFLLILMPFYARNIKEYSSFQSRPYIFTSTNANYPKSLKTTLGIDKPVSDRTYESKTSRSPSRDSISLPPYFNHLARVDESLSPSDIPFLFHIPRTGGSTLKDIMGSCLRLVGATDVGGRNDSGGMKSMKAVSSNELKVVVSKDGSRFINVDTSTEEGIQRVFQTHPDIMTHGLVQYLSTQGYSNHIDSRYFIVPKIDSE